MDSAGLLIFAGVYFVAVASPGPGIALIVARSLARGLNGLPWFIAGFVVGDLILFTLAASGLAYVARTFETAFLVIKYAGAAYLLYLAWKIWRTPAVAIDIDDNGAVPAESGWRAFLSSLLLTIGNPKAIVFFVSIMPLAVDMAAMTPLVFAELVAVIVLVITPVMTAVAVAADRARRIFRSQRALNRINKGTAITMAGVAVTVATR